MAIIAGGVAPNQPDPVAELNYHLHAHGLIRDEVPTWHRKARHSHWEASMFDELLFTVDEAKAEIVQTTPMATLELEERRHLQQWILEHPLVLGAGVEVIASEYSDWQDAKGQRVADRFDILGVDGDGRLVVAELKRDEAPHTIHMQAINYAAVASRLNLNDVAEMYVSRRQRIGAPVELEAALTWLQTVKLVTTETLKQPRIVLVATNFPAPVTASVVWLNEQGVDISLVRFRPYQLPGQVVVAFSQLFPVPDVEEFTINRRGGVSAALTETQPGSPWDGASLERLAEVGNVATLTAMDLCAQPEADEVRVVDIIEHSGLSNPQVRGHLAGLTMLLKNNKNGFEQNVWPFRVSWLAGGIAAYHMDADVAALWRGIRDAGVGVEPDSPGESLPPTEPGPLAETLGGNAAPSLGQTAPQ